MHDDLLYPRIPSLGSALTFGVSDPKARPTAPTDDEQFVHAMQKRNVTPIHDKDSKD